MSEAEKLNLSAQLHELECKIVDEDQSNLRINLEQNFEAFVRAFWDEVPGAGTMSWNWHMSILCSELQLLAERVFNGLTRQHDLIFNVSPGTSKSTIGSILFPAWTWTRMPQARHICASHTETLVLDLAAKARYVIQSEKFQSFWPVQLRVDQSTKSYYANTSGGDRLSCTVGGKSPTGFHAHFLTCLPGYVKISTSVGQVPIASIVENKSDLLIAGYDHQENKFEYQQIHSWQRSPGRRLLRIKLCRCQQTSANASINIYSQVRGWNGPESGQIQMFLYREVVVPLPSVCNFSGNRPTQEVDETIASSKNCEIKPPDLEQVDWEELYRKGMTEDKWILAGRPHWQCYSCRQIFVTIPIPPEFICPLCLDKDNTPTPSKSNSSNQEVDDKPTISKIPENAATGGDDTESTLFGRPIVWKEFPPEERLTSVVLGYYHLPTPLESKTSTGEVEATADLFLECTEDHPVFTLGGPSGGWYLPAYDLVPGDLLLGTDGSPHRVESIEALPDIPEFVYNLETFPNHNFFANGVLVHNCDDPIDPKRAVSEAELKTAADFVTNILPSRKVDKAVAVTTVIMQRLHECLLPGTLVRTPSGQQPIEWLEVDDAVFGSSGWQKITAVGSRNYQGQAFGVRLFGHPTVCWTTANHLYKTKRGWVRADQLTKNDWVFFPNVSSGLDIPWEEVRHAKPPKPVGAFTGTRRRSLTREQLEEFTGWPDGAIAKHLGIHRNTVLCYRSLYGLGRTREQHPIWGTGHLQDKDFWRVVGYWLAEGTLCYGRGVACGIRFTFGYSEQNLVDDVATVLDRYHVPVHCNSVPSALNCTVFSSQLARWLRKYFGKGAHGKRLPEFVFGLPTHCRRELLTGWAVGDGCVNHVGEIRGASVSWALLQGFQRLALSLGQPALVMKQGSKQVVSYIGKQEIHHSGAAGELRFGRVANLPARQKCRIDDAGCWYRVRQTDTKPYQGIVHDITTPSHDFVVGNATVHNSDPTGTLLAKAKQLGGVERIRHICLPARLADNVLPLGLREKYTEGLMDPDRLPEIILREQEILLGTYSFSGQYQQSPVPLTGGMFNISYFSNRVKAAPYDCVRIRYWDRAATQDGGCYTAGVLLAKSPEGDYYVEHVRHGQWEPDRRNQEMKACAVRDRARYGPQYEPLIYIEAEGGSSGRDSYKGVLRALAGFSVREHRPTGRKEVRAEPWSCQLASGNVHIVDNGSTDWDIEGFIQEHIHFPLGKYLDQVDASSGAFALLTQQRPAGGLRSYRLQHHRKKGLQVILCSPEQLTGLELTRRCLLIFLKDPEMVKVMSVGRDKPDQPVGEEGMPGPLTGGPHPPAHGLPAVLDSLTLDFLPNSPADFQESWDAILPDYGCPAEGLLLTREKCKKLWSVVCRHRDPWAEAIVLIDESADRALSVALALCDALGHPRDATLCLVSKPDWHAQKDTKPPNEFIYEVVRSSRVTVL